MKRRSYVLLLVLVFPLLFAAPVFAAPPVIEYGGFEEDSAVFDISPCDFEVRNYEVVSFRMTSFFDTQGDLLRIKMHISGTDYIYNPAYPDAGLSGSFSGNAEVDLATGELVWASGVPWHITAPGYGTVLVRAGRWSVYPDGQLAGKNSFVIESDIAQLCAALSGAPGAVTNVSAAASEPQTFLYLPTVSGRTSQ